MRTFLSHSLDRETPSYGHRHSFEIDKKSAILKGDAANESVISTTVHIGTHIDMPYHFFEDGQSVEDFDAAFWFFETPLVVSVKPDGSVIRGELITKLDAIEDVGYDILIVDTGIHTVRGTTEFWEKNYGFHPDIYDYLCRRFPKIRVLGFDSISVSSFADRVTGREAHRRFLNPRKPILLLEDMDLGGMPEGRELKSVTVAPLRIKRCDGLPCTVFGEWSD